MVDCVSGWYPHSQVSSGPERRCPVTACPRFGVFFSLYSSIASCWFTCWAPFTLSLLFDAGDLGQHCIATKFSIPFVDSSPLLLGYVLDLGV